MRCFMMDVSIDSTSRGFIGCGILQVRYGVFYDLKVCENECTILFNSTATYTESSHQLSALQNR